MLVAGAVAPAVADSGPPAAPPPLRLAELLAEVAARNPSLDATVGRIEAARIAIRRARALPDPYLTVMAEDLTPDPATMPMLRFTATEMIPWPGKLGRMARVEARMADAVAARADVTRLDVLAEGRRLFHVLYLNGEARRLNREQRAVVNTLVEMATARLAAGMPMHHDVLKMRTEAAMLDSDLLMLDADRREMAAMLNALRDRPAADPIGEPVAAWTPVWVPASADLPGRALAGRPELREMAAMAAAEHARAAVARKEYLPDFMVGVLYDLKLGGPDAAGAMLGLNVPLWIPWKQRLDAKAAELRARATERDRDAMAAMVRGDVERTLARLDGAERRLALLEREIMPLARETFDAGVSAYPAGKTSVLEVLDALRVVIAKRLEETALRVEREIAIVDLARAVGVAPEDLR